MISEYSFTKVSGNKEIRVTLEFPEQSDQKVEQEFTGRLKAVYLEKLLSISGAGAGEERVHE